MIGNSQAWLFSRRDEDIPLADDGLAAPYLTDEADAVRLLVRQARLPAGDTHTIERRARELVESMRRNRRQLGGLDAFMGEYDLGSQEGVVLMCLAEALLRIPDADVADALIADRLGDTDFEEHLGANASVFVNATTWALMLTGRIVHREPLERQGPGALLSGMVHRLGEPVIRAALRQAMRIVARQFVMGRTIEDALERAGDAEQRLYRHSFDMLGEAAMTAAAADGYLEAYAHAIDAVGRTADPSHDLMGQPGVSVKLSALSPRFEFAQSARAVRELTERIGSLAAAARDAGIALTIDAEEADRLELTLDVFRRVFRSDAWRDWPGFGIAVQAYQTRALHVVEWLEELAAAESRVIPVRLVKGAYWDTEIKRAQVQGLAAYPVFTRKRSTDVSYLACARRLLHESPHLYPQFATHNAHAVAWISQVGRRRPFEFQRLHGMGAELYDDIVAGNGIDRPCRVYAPVGSHEQLLPYLVRRLLENGANTSFVNRIAHEETPAADFVRDPVTETERLGEPIAHSGIALPRAMFGELRDNSHGVNLADARELEPLAAAVAAAAEQPWRAAPIVAGETRGGSGTGVANPAYGTRNAGTVVNADAATARDALDAASAGFARWNAVAVHERAARLTAAADLFEAHRAELAARIIAEAGRTVPDALADVREAVDFLRYYAAEAVRLMNAPVSLPGPTGEHNELRLTGRGVFVCISPWNFPVAIFTGQVAAALAAGNAVVAKPAEQTPLSAALTVELLMEAGIPADALQFLPGEGALLGETLLADRRVAGVAFTGSTATAEAIATALARRGSPQATLIAETGGINAMIVDSSALPEQLVRDVVESAFNSAGQRCSALRLLCLQQDTADDIVEMLIGRMAEIEMGDPALIRTDVGPVIDADAQRALEAYVDSRRERVLYRCALDGLPTGGHFVAPTLIALDAVSDLRHEVFGPILHVVRYRHAGLDAVVDALNSVGYGLTLGIHSRIAGVAERIAARARVGNIYVNRNMIGSVVGVQPFGGMGLSGTGPKAGGPHYLARFASEQTVTVNTSAVGGNAALLSLDDRG